MTRGLFAACHYAKPAVTMQVNMAVKTMKGKQTSHITEDHRIFKEPQRVLYYKIGFNPFIHKTADLNIVYVHSTLHPNVERDGYDPVHRATPDILL